MGRKNKTKLEKKKSYPTLFLRMEFFFQKLVFKKILGKIILIIYKKRTLLTQDPFLKRIITLIIFEGMDKFSRNSPVYHLLVY